MSLLHLIEQSLLFDSCNLEKLSFPVEIICMLIRKLLGVQKYYALATELVIVEIL